MTVSPRVAVLDWQTDVVSLVGLGLELGCAVVYLLGAIRARHLGRDWPWARTVLFLGGLLTLAVSLQSGFGRYDDIFWVHVVQHVALMAVAPALLMLGAPLVLALRALPARPARRLVGLLHGRWLRWMNAHPAAVHLPLHYYGIMYVYLLTPAYALGERNAAFHQAVHAYFIGCGLMFWLPVLGRYPAHWHPAQRTKVIMVAVGLPANALLALLVALRAPIDAATGRHETLLGALALLVSGAAVTVIGLLLLRVAAARRLRPAPAAATPASARLRVPVPIMATPRA